MNITKENVDALNAIVKVDIIAEDYKDQVTKVLNDYRKTANIPGFRKGKVPMGMVKKQYGKAVMIDEVNKLLQEKLNTFLTEEKLAILGNPLPKINKEFSWDNDAFSFEFELGLAPQFEVNLKPKKKITQYQINATEELIEKEVTNIQNRYGKLITLETAEENTSVTGTFVNQEKGVDKKGNFLVSDLKGKKNQKKLIGSKIGDTIELNTQKLFENEYKLQNLLALTKEEAETLDSLTLTIENLTKTEPADLDQELFDKLFPDGSVTTASQLKEKIKEDSEKQFQQQADQQLLSAITESLVENTKFDLPAAFLQKWLQTAGEKELTTEEAKTEYENSEKGLRYQLIEGKIITDNNIKLDYQELVNYTKGFVKKQMAQFGNQNIEEKELDDIANRVLANKEEAKRLENQLVSEKLLTFFKENMSFKTKKVSYEDFIKEVYKTK